MKIFPKGPPASMKILLPMTFENTHFHLVKITSNVKKRTKKEL